MNPQERINELVNILNEAISNQSILGIIGDTILKTIIGNLYIKVNKYDPLRAKYVHKTPFIIVGNTSEKIY